MLQKFFTDSQQLVFLKELLSCVPLPRLDTVRLGDFIVKNCLYIFDQHIIKSNITGTLVRSDNFSIIDHYSLGEYSINNTEKYFFNDSFYDSNIHRKLGSYLRYLRDCHDIDLMSMYNIFDYTEAKGIYLRTKNQDDQYKNSFPYVTENSDGVTVFQVPIKFNRKYTIAIDSPCDVIVYPVIKDSYSFLGSKNNKFFKKTGNQFYSDVNNIPNPQKLYGISFYSPKTYEVKCDSEKLFNYEKYLYLLIQVSNPVNSSLVVLEGDFSKENSQPAHMNNDKCVSTFIAQWDGFINSQKLLTDDCSDLSMQEIDKTLKSKIKLLDINDGTHYAYDDKIIQYLLQNAITHMDNIGQDFTRLYDVLTSNTHSSGIWDNRLRVESYNKFHHLKNGNPYFGISGFIDNDVESVVMKSKNVIIGD